MSSTVGEDEGECVSDRIKGELLTFQRQVRVQMSSQNNFNDNEIGSSEGARGNAANLINFTCALRK